MAFTFNRVELIGHVGNVPDVRISQEGQPTSRFPVATDRPARAGTESEAEWHQVVCFGRLAELAGQHIGKGRLVFVAGRLSYWTYEGRDGETRRRAEILASELILLDRRPTGSTETGAAPFDDEDLRA